MIASRCLPALLCSALGLLFVPPAVAVDFGNDSSQWANDGECDDPRFTGPGMTSTPLLDEDILADATDCRRAFQAGRISLRGKSAGTHRSGIDFGDDASTWANDGECDDPRFTGPGMTSTPLLDEDTRHDASDCRRAFQAGQIRLR
ncbi:MAG: hypothetical protein M0Q42_03335 [Xanthomonadales bacterium]|nr:hypothetical protein [Xanthomonadales bacterium]